MNNPTALEIICLRHGHYTNFPEDLTEKGVEHVRKVAEEVVRPWIARHQIDLCNLAIISSPTPRAHFTAVNIADVIGYDGYLIAHADIGPQHHDTVRKAKAKVRVRWYAFLARHIKRNPRPSIIVSHYDHLCNLVHDVFGAEVTTQETELQYAEPIYLSICPYDNASGLVSISGVFRGKVALALFNVFDHSIKRHI